ncbi:MULTISPECIES: nucleoside diphosphate kinase regulator [unclassified Phenylobacterium]|uniref:nucleoside diphosphate kinase regulator n=1 Tax=unclassified Phenylobacterium TaxID=2640670 RepID=UPI00083B186E|nr:MULTISPECIES: nucleoside diphosphate kinase regulator [unclassified Phenylobacterium]
MTTTTARAPARPPITLSETDAERLTALALQAEDRTPELAGLLLAELERARIRPDGKTAPDVVGVGSSVEFVDEAHGEPRTVQLVWPGEADIAAGKVSVLTHVGAGLLGLSAGQSILWPDRDGRKRALRIVSVRRG